MPLPEEDVLARFESAWKSAPPEPRLADHLPEQGGPGAHDLVVGLVGLDVYYRVRAGGPLFLARRYLDQPELGLDEGDQAVLVEEEYNARRHAGEPVAPADWFAAF